MTMLQLEGPAAETAFRLGKLRRELGALVPSIVAVGARFHHYAHLERALDDRERGVLEALLRYGTQASPAPAGALELHVVPRLGTISPWASKATDIARLCGLPVLRLERGRVFQLTTERALTPQEVALIAPLLHDRMTES